MQYLFIPTLAITLENFTVTSYVFYKKYFDDAQAKKISRRNITP